MKYVEFEVEKHASGRSAMGLVPTSAFDAQNVISEKKST
jgi:hypothetical protein